MMFESRDKTRSKIGKNLLSVSSLSSIKQLSEWKKIQNSRPVLFCKKFSKSTGKHLHWSLSLLESQMWILRNFYEHFCKAKWTAAFENHVYLNSIEQFPEFQSDDVIRIGNKIE